MNELIEISRKNIALEIFLFREENPGVTLAESCAKFGMTPATYRKWIASNDALPILVEFQNELQRGLLERIVVSKEALIEHLIQQGLKASVPGDIIATLKYLEDTEKRLGVGANPSESKAKSFLDATMPRLKKAEFHFEVSSEDTEGAEGGDSSGEVLEGEFLESESSESTG